MRNTEINRGFLEFLAVCEILCTSNILIPTIPMRYYCDKTCVISIMCVPCSLQICVLVLVYGVKHGKYNLSRIQRHSITHLQLPVRTVPRK